MLTADHIEAARVKVFQELGADLIPEVAECHARAIESAATAPLLAQIAALEEKVKAAEQASRWESDLCAQALDSMKQLEAQLAEARKDAERYKWISSKVHERPLRPAAYGSEMFPDMRLRYELPVLVSYDAIGQQISFDAAIDAAIAQEQPNTTDDRPSVRSI